MEENEGVSRRRSSFSFIHLVVASICLQFGPYDAIRQDELEANTPLDLTNSDPYGSSPFYFPPYDSLPPSTLPENTPPYCVYPTFTPQPPFQFLQTPPTAPYTPPPFVIPTPPSIFPPFGPPLNVPSPTQPSLSPPPPFVIPTPPSIFPPFSPPLNVPSPTQPALSPPPPYFEPSPPYGVPIPRFLPPIVYPPPSVPPPSYREPFTALWCVAKASVPDPIIQEAMNYACDSGADCGEIQACASCFEPDTLFAHASYAFNSYWQRTKVAGGTCDFGGTTLLVTVDPSYDGCHFIFIEDGDTTLRKRRKTGRVREKKWNEGKIVFSNNKLFVKSHRSAWELFGGSGLLSDSTRGKLVIFKVQEGKLAIKYSTGAIGILLLHIISLLMFIFITNVVSQHFPLNFQKKNIFLKLFYYL